MSLLDAFFNKGFKAAKCKTFLKLTIPRIKLLRNRRDIQIKQMRRDIAKLLETGQEATARIRVEHIVREENMMAAQEIIELFSELISVRLPIIETQRECPLDLKEAISSLCFAAPRCADLPELLQVQILFASKYGKEFVAAATELMPDCGVNRQLVELLSVRAPSPERKIKLLKEIAEEHDVEWDPEPSETEFLKPHEDLLNGPTQFVSGSTLPLPKEKHDETLNSADNHSEQEHSDSETGFEAWDFPEVPKAAPLRPTPNVASAPEIVPAIPSDFHPEVDHDSSNHSATSDYLSPEPHTQHKDVTDEEGPSIVAGMKEEKQYVPFMSPPSVSSASLPARKSAPPPPSVSRTKGDANEDLQDVISAAHTAAESAERAAAAARSAATLAQARISELTKKNSDQFPENGDENPFYTDTNQSPTSDTPQFDHQQSFSDHDSFSGDAYQTQHPTTDTPHFDHQQSFSDHDDSFSGDRYQTTQHPTTDTPQFDHQQSFSDHDSFSGDTYQSQHPTTADNKPQFDHQQSFSDVDSFSADPNPIQHSEDQHDIPSFDKLRVQYDSPTSKDRHADQGPDLHQPQRLPSMEDEPYFYPNLFTPQNSNPGSNAPSSTDKSRSTHEP